MTKAEGSMDHTTDAYFYLTSTPLNPYPNPFMEAFLAAKEKLNQVPVPRGFRRALTCYGVRLILFGKARLVRRRKIALEPKR